MEDHDFEKMTPFDQLISTQSLQILKLLIPYTPPENQRFLAVYTKFLELQHTIDFFNAFTAMSTHRILKRKHSLLFISFRKSDLIFLHSLEKHLTCS